LVLGGYGQGDNRHNFVGVIDEVKLYDRALSAAEVSNGIRTETP
jgi:rRNA pseudouridine-1189 N-methylase Emg1 (Nep1/Mra1 family)